MRQMTPVVAGPTMVMAVLAALPFSTAMPSDFSSHTWPMARAVGKVNTGLLGRLVVYENVASRECFGYVNGLYFKVAWPDTSQQFNGDAGRPAGYRLRPELDGHWYLYAYVYSGDGNSRSEWNVQVL